VVLHSLQYQTADLGHFWLNIGKNVRNSFQRTIFQHKLVDMVEQFDGVTGAVDNTEVVIITLDC
jgi:uncharacterized protein YutD